MTPTAAPPVIARGRDGVVVSTVERVTIEQAGAGSRTGLDRDLIVAAALKFIDQHGTQGLTMRGLGQELGVEAMALYRYVTGREDLLEAVVKMLLEDLHRDLDQQLSETWQGYLQTLAHAVRRIAVEHARHFRWSPLVTRPPPGCAPRSAVWSWWRTF